MAGGIYNSTPPTLVNGQTAGFQMDSAGRLLTTAAGLTGASSNQVQGTAADNAAAVGNPQQIAGKYNELGDTFDLGDVAVPRMDFRGVLFVRPGGDTSAGADAITNNVLLARAPGSGAAVPVGSSYVFNGATWDRPRGDTTGTFTVPKPATAGGLSIARLVASAGANLKAAAGQVYGGTVTNTNAAIRYLHLYNKATAATLSTDTPVASFALPPNATVQITTDGLGAAFATGISWAFTTDDIAIPTTAGATTDIHGTLFYK